MKKFVLFGLASLVYIGCDYREDHQIGSLDSGIQVGTCVPELSTPPSNTAYSKMAEK